MYPLNKVKVFCSVTALQEENIFSLSMFKISLTCALLPVVTPAFAQLDIFPHNNSKFILSESHDFSSGGKVQSSVDVRFYTGFVDFLKTSSSYIELAEKPHPQQENCGYCSLI